MMSCFCPYLETTANKNKQKIVRFIFGCTQEHGMPIYLTVNLFSKFQSIKDQNPCSEQYLKITKSLAKIPDRRKKMNSNIPLFSGHHGFMKEWKNEQDLPQFIQKSFMSDEWLRSKIFIIL